MEQAGRIPTLRPLHWKYWGLLPVGLLLIGWLLNTPAGLLGKADAIGYAVCHRIDVRSFHLGERPLPLCARCSGMYLGALVGLLYQALTRSRRAGAPPWPVILVLGLMVVAFGLDGLNSLANLIPGAPTLYTPQNWLRLLTGSGMGLGIAVALFPAFNQTAWRTWDARPAINGLCDLSVLVALALIVDLAVLSENTLILYPASIISAASVLLLLTIVYCMAWLLLLQRDNRYERLSQMLLPFSAGFGTALVQIALLDLARFWLTGSWSGFHFG